MTTPSKVPRGPHRRGQVLSSDAVCPRALHQLQINQYSRETEPDDPCIKAHAYSAKRFGIQPSYEIRAKRYSDYNAGDQNK